MPGGRIPGDSAVLPDYESKRSAETEDWLPPHKTDSLKKLGRKRPARDFELPGWPKPEPRVESQGELLRRFEEPAEWYPQDPRLGPTLRSGNRLQHRPGSRCH